MKRILLSGYFFAFFSAVCFSFKAILVKMAYTHGIDPLSLCLLRMFVSLPFFLLTLYLFEGQRGFSLQKKDLYQFSLMGILLGCAMLFSLYSIALLEASVATILAYIYPAFIVVLLFFLHKERIHSIHILSLVLTFLGLLLVVNMIGSDLGCPYSFLLSSYSVMTEKAIMAHSAIKVSTFAMLCMVVIFSFLFGWRIEFPFVPELLGIIVVLALWSGFYSGMGIQLFGRGAFGTTDCRDIPRSFGSNCGKVFGF